LRIARQGGHHPAHKPRRAERQSLPADHLHHAIRPGDALEGRPVDAEQPDHGPLSGEGGVLVDHGLHLIGNPGRDFSRRRDGTGVEIQL
jgi:hypothetical protein